MLLRPLSCLLAATALFAVSCGGGSSSSASSSKAPEIFLNSDLQGDYVGTMSEEFGSDVTSYLRCAENGYPYAGADGLGRDWVSVVPYSYAVVKPDGDIFLSYVVDHEVFYLEGSMTRAGLLSGNYWVLYDGLLQEEGTFEFARSAGAGHFSPFDHLKGTWTGSSRNDDGDEAVIGLELGSDGSLVNASRGGVALDPALSSSVVAFDDTTLGRLVAFDLVFLDGSSVQVSFALVSADGQVLEGPALDSEHGEVRFLMLRD